MADVSDTDTLRWCVLVDGKVYLEFEEHERARAKCKCDLLTRHNPDRRVELKLMRLVEVEESVIVPASGTRGENQ